jgi:hypothetical protein
MFDKVVQSSVAADKNENIQLYHSATNDASNSVKEASFTINYYSDKSKTTLAYSSSVSYNRHNPVYTAKSGGTFSSYAAMVEHSLTAGTKEYTVEIIPNDANSIYVEDITILVLGRTIDLGVFNIYDVLDVNAMASETDGENLPRSRYKGYLAYRKRDSEGYETSHRIPFRHHWNRNGRCWCSCVLFYQ